MIPESTPRYLGLRDAAKRYGTSKSTLYVLIKRGHIRAVKHGGRTLIDCASADKFFDGLPEVKPSLSQRPMG
jgi:excisionase family DNA binding protein